MRESISPQWLEWARELQSMAQTGLAYSLSPYDTDRYVRMARIAAEITSAHTRLGEPEILESFGLQPGYATPKVDVRGAVVADGQVLLVQEKSDGGWCLPGGWADVGETPSQMVVREVREESGLDVTPVRLVGVYDANRSGTPLSFFHAYKLIFLCEVTGGEPRGSNETTAARFFSFADPPSLSTERTNLRHLADVRAAALNAASGARFD
jgi:ADP-ribose pyrophosphatase YjhB (NUDIX family)